MLKAGRKKYTSRDTQNILFKDVEENNEKHVTRCLGVPILVLPYSTWFANSQICLNATGINGKGCLPHDAQNLFNVSLKGEEMDNEASSICKSICVNIHKS